LKHIAIKLSALTLGLTLAATHLNAEASSQTVQPTQKMEKLWMLTYVNGDGIETIAQTHSPSGETVPLMAVDRQRLDSIIALGKQLSAANNIQLTLVEFSGRSDVGEIKPN
jgi:hypothetical protein